MKILVKTENFDQKWKYWPKMKILVKTENCDQKWKYWPKMKILTKNKNFSQKLTHILPKFGSIYILSRLWVKKIWLKNRLFLKICLLFKIIVNFCKCFGQKIGKISISAVLFVLDRFLNRIMHLYSAKKVQKCKFARFRLNNEVSNILRCYYGGVGG